MEIVIKANSKGFKITEVPTVWQDRTVGQKKKPDHGPNEGSKQQMGSYRHPGLVSK